MEIEPATHIRKVAIKDGGGGERDLENPITDALLLSGLPNDRCAAWVYLEIELGKSMCYFPKTLESNLFFNIFSTVSKFRPVCTSGSFPTPFLLSHLASQLYPKPVWQWWNRSLEVPLYKAYPHKISEVQNTTEGIIFQKSSWVHICCCSPHCHVPIGLRRRSGRGQGGG